MEWGWTSNADDILRDLPLKARYQVQRSLVVKANAVFERLREKIVGEALGGQMLSPRTHQLQEAVEVIPAQIVGTSVEVGIKLDATRAKYGVYYEMGGKGQYLIKPLFAKALAFSDATFNPSSSPKLSDKAMLEFLIKNPHAPVPSAHSDIPTQPDMFPMMHVFRIVSHPPIKHLPFMSQTFAEFLPEIIASLGGVTPEETGWQGFTSPE